MTHPHQQEAAAIQNQESLQTLFRTLSLSQGQFSLILVRCNYTELRDRMVDRLRREYSIPIREVYLPTTIQTLYTTLEAELAEEQPAALMVLGLEAVNDIDRVLTSTNYVREEFRNNFPFPLVLWVTDRISKKLIRLVTDIESWTTTIEFDLSTDELIHFLRRSVEQLFSAVLEDKAWRSPNEVILGASPCAELELAAQDLENKGVELEPLLEAGLQFILGRQEYFNQHIEGALDCYQLSLQFWRSEPRKVNSEMPSSSFLIQLSFLLEGTVLFHIGLCYRRLAEQRRTDSRACWTEAKNYLQQCLRIFERAGRIDLVSEFINQLGEVLQQLEDWDALWELAVKSRQLHQDSEVPAPMDLAQDYGFLARVSLERKQWESAKEWAEDALDILPPPSSLETEHEVSMKRQHQGLYHILIACAENELGRKTQAVNHLETAHQWNNPAYDPQLYLQLLEMLRSLYFEQGHYLEAFKIKQEYRAVQHTYGFRAFIGAGRLQPRRQPLNPAVEATTPAPAVADEIVASGREEDLNRLIARMSSTQHKLTIIYGQSGVGKSSTVRAGLVPALEKRTIDTRPVLTAVLQVYNDWPRELMRQLTLNKSKLTGPLGMRLSKGISASGDANGAASNPHLAIAPLSIEESVSGSIAPTSTLDATASSALESTPNSEQILNLLRKNSEQNLLSVLIFDQFEEFFFVWKEPEKRLEFFSFLRQCLNISFVKVVLSVREDYLHYLLEFSRPPNMNDALNNDIMSDILNKDILFFLGNFKPQESQKVIQRLTERSQFYLESTLIEELVKDLGGELGEVRPIELQLVGAQLQEENITTLDQYQQLGSHPKQRLVERFLEEVVKDCGPENELAARRVLYLLTDENDTRPLKTRAELATDLAAFEAAERLDLILEIFVKSGLVFRWTEVPIELYQLVHDYLVAFIRQQQELDRQAEFEALQQQAKLNRAEIEQLRKEKELSDQLAEAKEKQRDAEEKLYRNRKRQLLAGFSIAVAGMILLAPLSWVAWVQKQAAEQATERAEYERMQAEKARINALDSGSEALVLSNERDQLGILVTSIKIGIASQNSSQIPPEMNQQITERLRQSISGVQELNRFEGHTKGIFNISFSPDGQMVASASGDGTVRLWSPDGRVLKTLPHGDIVTSSSFSADGKFLVTGCADNKVRLWQVNGTSLAKASSEVSIQPIATWTDHQDVVTSVSFSPDSKTVASASYDKTVKIWTVDGKLVQTLKSHQDWVLGVSFSPDGQEIATASVDKTIRLWRRNRQGNFETTPYKILQNRTGVVYGVSFSPDGQTVASASADNTARLWNRDGTESILKGHSDAVTSVTFSPDGERIATASADDTIKIWNRNGRLLATLRSHQEDVRAVSFSPDGQRLASASFDKTVKIWLPDSTPLSKMLAGHSELVYAASFSPNGQTIASASSDKTVKLWRPDGSLLKTLRGHQESVSWVSFSPQGNLLASASEDRTVKLWNLEGRELKTLRGHTNSVASVSFSPNGQIVATASVDKTVKLWTLEGRQLQSLNCGDGVNSVTWSPDGKTLVAASADKKVYLWRMNGGNATFLQTLDHEAVVNSVGFSPDGKTIASASADKTVKLWRFDGKKAAVRQTLSHPDNAIAVQFSPNGKTIVTASGDNTVRLWTFDGKNADLLKTLPQGAKVFSVSFSPDSQTMAFATRDRMVILLPVENSELDNIIVRGCDWLNDYLKNNVNLRPSDRTLCSEIRAQKLP